MEDGCLSAAGLMEHKLKIARLPKAGETLETTIYLKEEVYNITMVDAEVRIGDEVIATASLKSAVKDD